jgi:hypothetical protein
MKLIDVIEQLRKEEGIPVQHFIEGVMSTHSYYRYTSHQYEMKLSQGLSLIKKLKRSPESIFDYLAVVHQSPKSTLALFLQAKVNHHTHIIKKHQESLKSYVYDDIQLRKRLETYPNNESSYQYVYESLLLYDDLAFTKKILAFIDLTSMQKIKDNRYVTGILSYLYHHGLYASSLHKMLHRITNPTYFKSGSWDIPFLMSMHVLDKHDDNDYKKNIESYEKHILWISKRLTGSLDIGFISYSYKHLSYLYFLKDDERFEEMLYRYLSTLMLTLEKHTLDQEIETLNAIYHINIHHFYESYTKAQIHQILHL